MPFDLQHPPAILHDVLRLSLWLVILSAVFVPIERLFSLRPQKVCRKQAGVDAGYYFLNGLIIGAVLSVPLGLAAWAGHKLVPWPVQTTIAGRPVWARALLALVVGEFGYYWGHRLCHEVPLLWRFHAIHHSARQMDFLANSRGHPIDLVIGRLFTFLPIYMLGIANPLSRSAGLLALMIGVLAGSWSFLIHANVRWRLGPLEWIIASPAFHHWHHTRAGPINRNYATMLPCMDYLFGTHHRPNGAWPEEYGIPAEMPATLLGQLLEPFQPSPAPAATAEPAQAGVAWGTRGSPKARSDQVETAASSNVVARGGATKQSG